MTGREAARMIGACKKGWIVRVTRANGDSIIACATRALAEKKAAELRRRGMTAQAEVVLSRF